MKAQQSGFNEMPESLYRLLENTVGSDDKHLKAQTDRGDFTVDINAPYENATVAFSR